MSKRIAKCPVITKADASAPTTSIVTNTATLDSASFHISFDSIASGTFKVLVRNAELRPEDPNGWYELNFGAPLALAGDTDAQILLNSLDFIEMKLEWTPTAASGEMNAYVVAKGII